MGCIYGITKMNGLPLPPGGRKTVDIPLQGLPPSESASEASLNGTTVRAVDVERKMPSSPMGLSSSMARSLSEYKVTRREKVRRFLFYSIPLRSMLVGAGIGAGLGAPGFLGGPIGIVTMSTAMAIGGIAGFLCGLGYVSNVPAGTEPDFSFFKGFNFSKVAERRNSYYKKKNDWTTEYNLKLSILKKLTNEDKFKIGFPDITVSGSEFETKYKAAVEVLESEEHKNEEYAIQARDSLERARSYNIKYQKLKDFSSLRNIEKSLDSELEKFHGRISSKSNKAWIQKAKSLYDPEDLHEAFVLTSMAERPSAKEKEKLRKRARKIQELSKSKNELLEKMEQWNSLFPFS